VETTDGNAIPKDADHLIEGGIYSVRPNQGGRGNFVLAKIVQLSPEVVHVVVYSQTFKKRPALAAVEGLDLTLPSAVSDARARHLPLSRKLFAMMRPVFLLTQPLKDSDLAGLRQWSLLSDREIVEAPTYIQPENNRGVYLRIFLLCGLPFGALQGVYQYSKNGAVAGVFAFVMGIFLFGGAMTWLQHQAVRRRAHEVPDQASASAFQIADVVLDKTFGETFSLCQQAIRVVKNCRVLEEDFSGGTLEGKVGISLTSEGEHIVLTTYVVGDGRTGVVVASVPRAGGDVDFGKNLDNVTLIVNHLKMAAK